MTGKNWMCAVTGFFGSSFLWSATSLSTSWVISLIVFIVSLSWISLFIYANEIYRRD